MNEIATRVITIDPDFAAIWGDLEGTALEGLRTEIMVDGIRDPLVIWNKDNKHILVDGHNRLRIAKERNLPVVPVSYKVFKDKAEAAIWIISHQESRRNMTDWQKYKAIEVYHKIVKEKAKERQAEYRGNQYESAVLENSPKVQSPINTRKEVSKASGLSEWKVRQGDYIRDKATDEQKAALDSGKKTMKEVFNETYRENHKKPDPIKEAEKVVEATKQSGTTIDLRKAKVHKDAEQMLLKEKALAADGIIYRLICDSRKLTDEMIDAYCEFYSRNDGQAFMVKSKMAIDAGKKLIRLGNQVREVTK